MQAFQKRDRRLSAAKDGDAGTAPTPAAQTDSKKSTEWFLESWANGGVQSTTRYRKDNQSRRSAASQGRLAARVYKSYPAHHHHHHHHSFSASSIGSRKPRAPRQGSSAAAAALHSSAAATHHLRQPHYYHPSAGTAAPPFLHHRLLSDPSPSGYAPPPSTATTSPYSPFFHHPTLDSTTTTSSTTGLEYDYPSPLLYPSVPGTSMSARAASEATVDEPLTPEPPLHATPIPVSYGGGAEPQQQQQQQQQQYGSYPATAYPLHGVYDELDAVQHQHQQHRPHQQGWGLSPLLHHQGGCDEGFGEGYRQGYCL